jgi:hypothetical protein
MRGVSGSVATITRIILCSASAWPIVGGVLGMAGVDQGSNTFPALGFLLIGIATLIAIIWFALLARQMQYRKLSAGCFLLAVYALVLVWFALQFSAAVFSGYQLGPAWWPRIFPDIPLLGPLWNIDWSFVFEGELTLHSLPSMIWVCASSGALAIFGIAFLRLGFARIRAVK